MEAGLRDLAEGRETREAMLVSMARTRLVAAGLDVPRADVERPSHRLYELLADEDSRTAHSRYNALTRRLVSYARAAEHARTR